MPECFLYWSLFLTMLSFLCPNFNFVYNDYEGDADGTPDGQETVSQLVQTGMVLEMKR